jgi:hypothetical protein
MKYTARNNLVSTAFLADSQHLWNLPEHEIILNNNTRKNPGNRSNGDIVFASIALINPLPANMEKMVSS